jgi:hypothetical protein
VPLYPFLAIVTGIFIYSVFQILEASVSIKRYFSANIIPVIFLFLVFIIPYKELISRTLDQNQPSESFYGMCHFLKDADKNKVNLNGFRLLSPEYSPHIMFYIKALKVKGTDISFFDYHDLKPGDKVITNNAEAIAFVEKNFEYQLSTPMVSTKLYIIGSRKPDF